MITELCGTTDVKKHIDPVGRWSATTIVERIVEQTDEIYYECGYPLAGFYSQIGQKTDGTYELNYFVGEKKIYDIDRVFVGTATKRELDCPDDFLYSTAAGIISLQTSTVGGSQISTEEKIYAWYVPKIFKEYCALRVARNLIEESDVVSGESGSKTLEVINNKIERIESRITDRIGLVNSQDNLYYDPIYTQNLKEIKQDFRMNDLFLEHSGIGSTGTFIKKATYSGSDCSGNDGETGRILTASRTLTENNLVVVNGAVLIEDTDYSYSGNTITFSIPIYNSDKIVVYF